MGHPHPARLFSRLAKIPFLLIERGIIRARGMLADATVFPEEIKFPTDVGLLNDVRRWTVRTIKTLGGKFRTRRRKAEKEFLSFSKTKRKTRKIIRKAKKSMLQYVRRNLGQMEQLVRKIPDIEKKVLEYLAVSKEIFHQRQAAGHAAKGFVKRDKVQEAIERNQAFLVAQAAS